MLCRCCPAAANPAPREPACPLPLQCSLEMLGAMFPFRVLEQLVMNLASKTGQVRWWGRGGVLPCT